MAITKIEIISDTVCPWCYLGYRRLERAIRLYRKTYPGGSAQDFELIWKPYILDPNPVDESVSVHDRMLSKMPPEKVPQAQEHIKRLEFHEGIAFNFGGRVGSSVPSRQLLYLGRARGAGVQTRVAEELFRGLWEGERDISHIGTLVEIAGLCGLDVDEVRVALEKGEGVEEVKREQDEVKGSGVRGVPHYIVGGMHLDGAVDLEDFFDVLVKAKESR